jgi:hypothetical protein
MNQYKQIINDQNTKVIQVNTGRERYLNEQGDVSNMSLDKLRNLISKLEGYPPQDINFVKT